MGYFLVSQESASYGTFKQKDGGCKVAKKEIK